MGLTCNLDRRGRRARAWSGAVLLLVAAGFLLFAGDLAFIGWVFAISMAVVGGFAIFEAMKGWCAIRAMGFRTWL